MVVNDLRNPSDHSCYRWLAKLHGFNQRQRQALPQRWDGIDVQRGEEVGRVRAKTDKTKVFLQAQGAYQLLELLPLRTITCNRESGVRRFGDDARGCFDQEFKALLRIEPTQRPHKDYSIVYQRTTH